MKKLFICETPFQIIVALYIKNQFLKSSDKIDIVIANTFNGSDEIAKRLRKTNIFNNVILADVKRLILGKGILNYFLKLFYSLFPSKLIKKIWNYKIKDYSEMYCWNYDVLSASIRSYFELHNMNIKFFIYEEGYISYFPFDEVNPIRGFMKIIETRNKLFGKGNIIRKNIDGLFLFEPDCLLFKPTCPIYQIDRDYGKNKKIKNAITSIFNSKDTAKKYDKKYIIFEENYPDLEDEEILLNIIEIVGKDNVIIKLHPRRNIDRFSSKGIKTLGNDGVPWEAITFAGDFSNKILISIGSGSITSYRMLFGNNMNAYMLFRFVKPNLPQFNKEYSAFWRKLESSDNEGGIYMPNTKKEFYDSLKRKSGVN